MRFINSLTMKCITLFGGQNYKEFDDVVYSI